MLPSMFSGISGLKVNQKKLDVVGNNIANSSTTAFKTQRVRFQDMISQSVAQATGASANLGGTNPRQVGLGVQIAGIDTSTATGSMQPTSNNLDAAIDGSGYFIVGSGIPPVGGIGAGTTGVIDVSTDGTQTMSANSVTPSFTRDGSFTLDTQGSLLTSDGLRVYGYANNNLPISYDEGVTDPKAAFTLTGTFNATGGVDKDIATANGALIPLVIPDSISDGSISHRVQSFSIGKDGLITATLDTGGTAVLGQIGMASFKNAAGLTKMGKNTYQTSPNSGNPVVRSASGGDTTTDNSKGYGDVLQGVLEMSNVDLAEEFTNMIIANRAFQANGKIITTGDEILQDLVGLKR